MSQAESLKRAKDLTGSRAAALEAARWSQQAKELLRREELAHAERHRDYFARMGIELAKAGDIPRARKAAKEAERWARTAKRLGSS